tara:strand:- start:220 stop:840 length:621 start_codon:yes stop_codon:yes gene_type:complete
MTNKYWNSFYRKFDVNNPSNFAKFCVKKINKNDLNLDVGCGNGRDTNYFVKKGYKFIGTDLSTKVVELNNKSYGNFFFRSNFCSKSSKFNFLKNKKIINIYARFFIHTINLKDQIQFFKNIKKYIPKNGKVLLEFRTTKDPMMRLGKKISFNERISSHYRRFIDVKKFEQEIFAEGFKVVYKKQSFEFAKFGNQRPHICRFILKQR